MTATSRLDVRLLIGGGAGAIAIALMTLAGLMNGCGTADCNDTATCLFAGDEVLANANDGFVEANDDGGGMADDAGDANDDTEISTDSPPDTSSGQDDASDALFDAVDAAGDGSDAGDGDMDASDGPAEGPNDGPVDMGVIIADVAPEAPPPPPPKCKSSVLSVIGAVASSTSDPNTASQAIDINFSTRWESVWKADPQWIYVDFGAPVFINRVQIAWLRACAANYDLQVSDNASTWKTIRSINGNGAGGASPADWSTAVDHTGLVGVGRYLRVFGKTRCDTGYGYSMWEMQVSGDKNQNCAP